MWNPVSRIIRGSIATTSTPDGSSPVSSAASRSAVAAGSASPGSARPPGEGDPPGVVAQPPGPPLQDDLRAVRALPEQHQHGRLPWPDVVGRQVVRADVARPGVLQPAQQRTHPVRGPAGVGPGGVEPAPGRGHVTRTAG